MRAKHTEKRRLENDFWRFKNPLAGGNGAWNASRIVFHHFNSRSAAVTNPVS
jgi:hypothetical protein